MHVVLIGMAKPGLVRCRKHCHSYWEITYFIQGHGTIVIGDKSMDFKENDIICQPAGIPHYEYAEQEFRDIFVIVEDFISPGPNIPRFADNSNHDFGNILLQMYREFHLKQNNWSRIVDSLFNVLYQYMNAWNESSDIPVIVDEFEKTIVANITNHDFKIGDHLSCMPVSAEQFRRIFKKQTGKSPVKYLLSKRIEYAKQLLDSNRSLPFRIKEISAMTGFDDPYYFSRLFKKATGISPTEWSLKKAERHILQDKGFPY